MLTQWQRVPGGPISKTGCWLGGFEMEHHQLCRLPYDCRLHCWTISLPTTPVCYQNRVRRGARRRPGDTQVADRNRRRKFDVVVYVIDDVTAARKNRRLLQLPTSVSSVDVKLSSAQSNNQLVSSS